MDPLTPPQPPGRPLADPGVVRQAIFDSALETVRGFQPFSNTSHTLAVENPSYDRPRNYRARDVSNAILGGTSLSQRLRADLVLKDNASGSELARKRTTIAQIPWYTDDGVFVDNGSEYSLANQTRLNPGVFARVKNNGDLEAHTVALPGQGVPHRLFLEPKSGIFRGHFDQANIPLVSLLRTLGTTDQQLREAWGDKLAAQNIMKSSPADLAKLYGKIVRGGTATDMPTQQQQIREALENTKLDPDVMQKTLGAPYDRVNAEVLLKSTRKLLAIKNKDNAELLQQLKLDPADPDDRDNPAFMSLVGPEDVISERLRAGSRQLKQILWKAGRMGNFNHVQAGILDRHVRDALLNSGLGQVLEGINPMQHLEQQLRVTRMGVGGIPSADSVPISSRNVQTSHFGIMDPIATPESMNAGVDLRFSRHIRKGPKGELFARFNNVKTGQPEWLQPKQLFNSVIAFPGEMRYADSNYGYVKAIENGKMTLVEADKVTHELGHGEDMFGPTSNMVPLKSAMKGQRGAMGARMGTQALSLEKGEAPFVQNAIPDEEDRSFDELYGEKMGAVRAKQGGQVLSIDEDSMQVRYADGTTGDIGLYNHKPSNRKTYLHQTPTVQPGQTFNPGDLLVRSNYTDDKGSAALGLNVRTGFVPFDGANHDDALALSASLAARLSSQHMYQFKAERDKKDPIDKKRYMGMFAGRYDKRQMEALDDNGIVRKGQVVEPGDPLVLGASQRPGRVGTLSRARSQSWTDQTETWDHHQTGIVTHVAPTKTGVTVAVKAISPLEVADKVSNRFGGKGVVAKIIPDDEMPIAEDGKPLELLANPLGTISRSNPSQNLEAMLGKIAAITGKPYKIKDFGSGPEGLIDLNRFVQTELEKHGLKEKETITDPMTGRQIPNIAVGNTYLMKLHHLAESKAAGRGLGAYTSEGVPSKGGPDGSKTWGMLHLNALLSHGATGAIRSASMIRGQRNPQYWAAVMSGRTPPDPEVPQVYRKFVAQLQAGGINPVRRGTKTHLFAMTDKTINDNAGDRELKNPGTVDWENDSLPPVQGGLFDEGLFGGPGGKRWAKITLHEPMPNPVMEEPIRRVLGLTQKQFLGVISGTEELNGATGPAAIGDALNRIDIPREIAALEHTIRTGRKTARDAAIRKIGFLRNAAESDIHPRDWMWKAAPILPPEFRPVSVMQGSKLPMVADMNYLYRDLYEANQNLKTLTGQVDTADERGALYGALKAVVGLGDPVTTHSQEQEVKGAIRQILGSGPKNSVMQRKLLGSRTDTVGRAAVVPNPDLDMDEIAIPEEQAWKVYQPWIVRHLVQRGMQPLQAAMRVEKHDNEAKTALLEVMKTRPVIADRSPVLHRYGVMAFWPRLTKNKALETSPVINKGFNLDHDGDTMQFHVPASDDEVRDATEKMLPSKNLLAVSNFRAHYVPQQEFQGGLYAGSTARDDRPALTFATRADALRAIASGQIPAGRQIDILED